MAGINSQNRGNLKGLTRVAQPLIRGFGKTVEETGQRVNEGYLYDITHKRKVTGEFTTEHAAGISAQFHELEAEQASLPDASMAMTSRQIMNQVRGPPQKGRQHGRGRVIPPARFTEDDLVQIESRIEAQVETRVEARMEARFQRTLQEFFATVPPQFRPSQFQQQAPVEGEGVGSGADGAHRGDGGNQQ